MTCPLCGSAKLKRDYAPARSYALIMLGLALLAGGRLFKPEMVVYPLELHKLVIVGVAVLLFGLFDTIRHGNRFCLECGYRLRTRSMHSSCGFMSRVNPSFPAAGSGTCKQDIGERPGARFIRGSKVAAAHDHNDDDAEDEINPNTPLEPILACLKFKDPNMRRDAARNLRKITGQDFGEDHAAWCKWHEQNWKNK